MALVTSSILLVGKKAAGTQKDSNGQSDAFPTRYQESSALPASPSSETDSGMLV